jgi:NIMA (never in mitosis gene a)-related kinase
MERYNIIRRIGRGCYGDVLLAVKLDNQKLYAIKRVQLEEDEKVSTTELNNEVQVLASLSHPNIIRYYESFTHEENL